MLALTHEYRIGYVGYSSVITVTVFGGIAKEGLSLSPAALLTKGAARLGLLKSLTYVRLSTIDYTSSTKPIHIVVYKDRIIRLTTY